MPGVLGGSWGDGRFLMGEVPLYRRRVWAVGVPTREYRQTEPFIRRRAGNRGPDVNLCVIRGEWRSTLISRESVFIDSGLVSTLMGPLWEGYHESRSCSRDTYPESYITEYY